MSLIFPICQFPFFSGEGKNCTLIDACTEAPCDANADCSTLVNETSHEASHVCACKTGWQGNGFYCLDVNECLSGDTCDDHARCENSQGEFTCTCQKERWIGHFFVGHKRTNTNGTCRSDSSLLKYLKSRILHKVKQKCRSASKRIGPETASVMGRVATLTNATRTPPTSVCSAPHASRPTMATRARVKRDMMGMGLTRVTMLTSVLSVRDRQIN